MRTSKNVSSAKKSKKSSKKGNTTMIAANSSPIKVLQKNCGDCAHWATTGSCWKPSNFDSPTDWAFSTCKKHGGEVGNGHSCSSFISNGNAYRLSLEAHTAGRVANEIGYEHAEEEAKEHSTGFLFTSLAATLLDVRDLLESHGIDVNPPIKRATACLREISKRIN